MGGDVAVGVPGEARALVGEGEPGQVHRDAVGEAVHVGADAGAGVVVTRTIMPGPGPSTLPVCANMGA